MKQIITPVIFLLFLPFIALSQDSNPHLKIGSGELLSKNCKKGHASFELAPKSDAVIYIDFATNAKAKAALPVYKLFYMGKALTKMQGTSAVNQQYLVIIIKDPFAGTADKQKSYEIRKGATCLFNFTIKLKDSAAKADADGKKEWSKEELLALAKKQGFTISLDDLLPTNTDPCCMDKTEDKCCDENIIRYDARCNKITTNVRTFKNNRWPLRVNAGDGLRFRVINLNPDAYKVEIDDTAEAYFQETTALLDKFFAGTTGGDAVSLGKDDPGNILRGGLLMLVENLYAFERRLQYACLGQHYDLIAAKIEARKRVDIFLERLGKAPAQFPEQFMMSQLDLTTNDSSLYQAVKKLYNQLPATYYNLESLYPEVPRNKDVIRYKFNIKARSNTPYVDKVVGKEIKVYIVHNWKVDVSSGFYYTPGLTAMNYASLDTTRTYTGSGGADSVVKGKRLIKDKHTNGEFGFNSLIHYSYKFTPSFAMGFHLGAGVNLNDEVTPRYFGGFSALLGNERGRLGFNAGVVLGNVKEISSKYESGVDNAGAFIGANEEATYVKRLQASFYVGLSYNLPFGFSNRKADVKPEDDKEKEK